MTLDEAIKHAEEVAEENYNNAVCILDKSKSNISNIALEKAMKCKRCASEHRQLAEWLKELKLLREQKCENAISRQAVLDLVNADWKYEGLEEPINSLPPVTLQPKTGHWIKVHPLQADDPGAYMCSCCKVGDWNLKGTEKFCPNCGAEMTEEDKE